MSESFDLFCPFCKKNLKEAMQAINIDEYAMMRTHGAVHINELFYTVWERAATPEEKERAQKMLNWQNGYVKKENV